MKKEEDYSFFLFLFIDGAAILLTFEHTVLGAYMSSLVYVVLVN